MITTVSDQHHGPRHDPVACAMARRARISHGDITSEIGVTTAATGTSGVTQGALTPVDLAAQDLVSLKLTVYL